MSPPTENENARSSLYGLETLSVKLARYDSAALFKLLDALSINRNNILGQSLRKLHIGIAGSSHRILSHDNTSNNNLLLALEEVLDSQPSLQSLYMFGNFGRFSAAFLGSIERHPSLQRLSLRNASGPTWQDCGMALFTAIGANKTLQKVHIRTMFSSGRENRYSRFDEEMKLVGALRPTLSLLEFTVSNYFERSSWGFPTNNSVQGQISAILRRNKILVTSIRHYEENRCAPPRALLPRALEELANTSRIDPSALFKCLSLMASILFPITAIQH